LAKSKAQVFQQLIGERTAEVIDDLNNDIQEFVDSLNVLRKIQPNNTISIMPLEWIKIDDGTSRQDRSMDKVAFLGLIDAKLSSIKEIELDSFAVVYDPDSYLFEKKGLKFKIRYTKPSL